jgi:tellurite methyltransferase
VLVEGTTFLDMFDASAGYCLWTVSAVRERFRGWELLHCKEQDFPAPGDTVKRFVTLMARKPVTGRSGA